MLDKPSAPIDPITVPSSQRMFVRALRENLDSVSQYVARRLAARLTQRWRKSLVAWEAQDPVMVELWSIALRYGRCPALMWHELPANSRKYLCECAVDKRPLRPTLDQMVKAFVFPGERRRSAAGEPLLAPDAPYATDLVTPVERWSRSRWARGRCHRGTLVGFGLGGSIPRSASADRAGASRSSV